MITSFQQYIVSLKTTYTSINIMITYINCTQIFGIQKTCYQNRKFILGSILLLNTRRVAYNYKKIFLINVDRHTIFQCTDKYFYTMNIYFHLFSLNHGIFKIDTIQQKIFSGIYNYSKMTCFKRSKLCKLVNHQLFDHKYKQISFRNY